MTHRPTWYTSWQALTQAVNLVTTSNFLTRFYAYNGFYFVFNDLALTREGVLAGLDTATQNIVYSDPFYGMDSVSKLTYWFAANIEGEGGEMWTKILAYYLSIGVDLTQ
jgi:hypothetical protein